MKRKDQASKSGGDRVQGIGDKRKRVKPPAL